MRKNCNLSIFSPIVNMPTAPRDEKVANEVENEWKREAKRGQTIGKGGIK